MRGGSPAGSRPDLTVVRMNCACLGAVVVVLDDQAPSVAHSVRFARLEETTDAVAEFVRIPAFHNFQPNIMGIAV